MPKKKDKTKPPVLLQVLPALHSGGVERGTVEIARAVHKAGFRSLVASSGGYMEIDLKRSGAEHINLPLDSKNPFTIWRNIKRLEKIIKREEVSIIHARSRAPAWSAYFAAKRTNIPFVTTFHGLYNNTTRFRRWYNSIMVKGDAVIAISDFIADHIKENYKVRSNRLHVIHRGVDYEYFNPDKINPERIIKLTKQWNLPEEVPVIMVPARITRWKGHKFFLDSLRLLPHKNYCCLFVGSYDGHEGYLKELRKLIKQHGIVNNCRFVGNATDMPAAYSLASVVVSSSVQPEAFGRVPIEAGAMERLVVATNIGGATETIVNSKTGWLVEPNNPQAMADTIQMAMDLPHKDRQKIVDEAKKFVTKNFSLQKMYEKTIEVYMSLLD